VSTIAYEDFEKVDVRVGVITEVEDFPRARKPSYKLTIDFGPEIGVKRSSAQVTSYSQEELRGMQVVAVVNFEPRNIAGFMSEVLVLGAADAAGQVVLLTPTREAVVGGRMH
jgi:tRNA-binding protein